MSQLIAMFCDIDDFCKGFEPLYTESANSRGILTASEAWQETTALGFGA